MAKAFLRAAVLALALSMLSTGPSRAADNYQVDGMHSGVTFRISHLGLCWVFGRFNDFSGRFSVDAVNPATGSFELTIKVESVDTNNKKRDDHLRSPDFFNVKQFPLITFKSTAVKPIKNGYQVTGNLTIHGVTKSISFPLTGGRTAEFPKGVTRTGYTMEFTLKRSEFGMDAMIGPLGDDVIIGISFEGVKK
jgi:polyisoprenoid-binding protein YceI